LQEYHCGSGNCCSEKGQGAEGSCGCRAVGSWVCTENVQNCHLRKRWSAARVKRICFALHISLCRAFYFDLEVTV
jgi:hypothetical protein